jgi:hypothetical protein
MDIYQAAALSEGARMAEIQLARMDAVVVERKEAILYAAEAIARIRETYPTAVAAYFQDAPNDVDTAQITTIVDGDGQCLFSSREDDAHDPGMAQDYLTAAVQAGYPFRSVAPFLLVLDITPIA